MFGGRGTPNEEGIYIGREIYSNELWYLDLKTFEWHACEVGGDIPTGRRSHSACKFAKRQNKNDFIIKNINFKKIDIFHDFLRIFLVFKA